MKSVVVLPPCIERNTVVKDTRLDPLPLVSDGYVDVDAVFMFHLNAVEVDAPDGGVGKDVLCLALHARVHELLTVIRHRLPCSRWAFQQERQEDSYAEGEKDVRHDDETL